MVKLLRLKGKLSDNPNGNTEIINNFRQPVLVKPYSRIALVGIDLALSTEHELREESTIIYNGVTITLPAGTYDADEITTLLSKLIGYNAGGSPIEVRKSKQIDVLIDPDQQLRFEEQSIIRQPTPFASEFDIVSGETQVQTDTGSLRRNQAVPEDLVMQSLLSVPNTGFHFETILDATTATDELTYGVFAGGNFNHDFAAFDISDAQPNYRVVFKGVSYDTGISKSALVETTKLRISMTRLGNVEFVLEIPDGTVVYNSSIDDPGLFVITEDEWEAYFGNTNIQNMIHQIIIPNDSDQYLTESESTLKGDGLVQSRISLSFGSDQIKAYLGFRQTPKPALGDPAIITADDAYGYWVKDPGIMVCIDPFLLDSFDGAADATYQPNILYVIHDPDYSGNSLRLDVPSPVFLNINNESEMNLSTIRVSFWNSTGGAKTALSFEKPPIVTLMIDDGTDPYEER